ncbi:uncharacterized protein LOC104904458 isoform X4 [Beta vulgaris subsp. vulgaris]|uniref:uncharacterized protein LOC104904458 isoform X4 n=1 Tax=Beta vulgaris subsp. vulgaris TaxID=3555 RepID=UPI0020369BA7|nr:uncharacterized protein LOC104904458 isoform X4 [Beta vulgaris subsp. vulgaris]
MAETEERERLKRKLNLGSKKHKQLLRVFSTKPITNDLALSPILLILLFIPLNLLFLVGVIIGRGGDMIKNLELESGARIQITPDADADPTSLTRDVELMGTQEQISRAEERINEVIAAADSTNSASFGDRSAPPPQAGGERLVIKVPNDKVGLIIGKGGKSIKAVQSMSGARIQVIPLHCPPGDYSTKRNIYINGTMKQIEYAEELVYEVMSGNPLKYQGYPQQPNHGQDGQATPEAKPYAYGPPATSSQPDGSAAVQTSQQGYETRVAYGSDGTAQSQPPSAYATGYGQPPPHVPYVTQTNQYSSVPRSKKICIPNTKVGVIIGRGGYMVKNLQLESGAKIQILPDADINPTFLTRDVELMGTQEQINRAEQRINEVIAAADSTNSASFGDRSGPPPQAGDEQLVMKVPHDKVARVIGKGGESIKAMQSKSGACIQVVPLHLPPGDYSTEREFISGSGYPPSAAWTPQGQPSAHQPPAYGYSQTGTYAMPQPPYYGGYPPRPTTWDQSAALPQQQNTGYNAYGQGPPASTPPDVHYNYGQVAPAYNYNQGYPQQPYFGQDGQATPEAKPYAYGPPATSSQPDGSAAVQTSQQGYETPAAYGSYGTAQSQPPSAYAMGYGQPPPHGNDYSAYPSYSGAPAVQPYYNQTGYAQASYGQQQEGQVASQASYPYYGQSWYPSSQAPAQAGYYHSAYPSAIPPAQEPPHIQPQTSDSKDSSNVAGAAAEKSEDPQS